MKLFIKTIIILSFSTLISGCGNDMAASVKKTDKSVYDRLDTAWNDDEKLDAAGDYKIEIPQTDPDKIITAAASVTPLNNITLPEAVAIAAQNNREYTTQKELLYLTALDQTDVEHLYETMFFSNVTSGVRKDGSDKANGTQGDVGFSQLLSTGATITSNISIGSFDILSGNMKSGLATIANAAICQPLLRGAGRKVALENLTQAQQNTLYQIRSFNRFRKVFITTVIKSYYEVLISETKLAKCQRTSRQAVSRLYEAAKKSGIRQDIQTSA